MAGIRGRAIAAPGPRPQPLAALTQFHLHPRIAVTAVVLGVDRGDRNRQGSILTSSPRYRPPAPGIEPGPRDRQHPAHQRYGETGLLRFDESESHALSLAKKAVAFFRISRSIRKR